jgi:hypothetical protein
MQPHIDTSFFDDEDKGNNFLNELENEAKSLLREANGLSKYDYLRITSLTAIPEPVAIISINGETISTAGNITVISGASKSGKSAFTGWLLAGAISTTGFIKDNLNGLFVEPNSNHKAVLHFDTEQARHKQQGNIKSILRRSGLESFPEYFLSYNLRQIEMKNFKSVTDDICKHANKNFNGIHLIFIDGIADYISTVNDEVESNEIVKFIEMLAIKYSTPVIIIIHTNPNSEKERGHLGSHCQRKCESLLAVKTEGEISFVEPKLLRSAGKGNISNMRFMYDKNKGYHIGISEGLEISPIKENEKLNIIEDICKIVFAPPVANKYEDAIKKIMTVSKKGETTAKNFFKDMKSHGLINQGNDKLWRLQL